MKRKNRDRFHTSFTRADVRHKSDPNKIGISEADLCFLQALGRLR